MATPPLLPDGVRIPPLCGAFIVAPPPPGPRDAKPPAPPPPIAAPPPPPPLAAPPAPPPAPPPAAPPPPPLAAPPPPPPLLAAPPPLARWASAKLGSMAASAIAVVITNRVRFMGIPRTSVFPETATRRRRQCFRIATCLGP